MYQPYVIMTILFITDQILADAQVKVHDSLSDRFSHQRSRPISKQMLPLRIVRTIDSNQAYEIIPQSNEEVAVTVKGRSSGHHVKLDSLLMVLDRVVYSITRPANIFNIIKFTILALSTLIMSTIVFPLADLSKPRASRYSGIGTGSSSSRTNSLDMDNIIELMAKFYDDRIKPRPSTHDRSLCRERSLCIIGDMMACDFPSIVTTISKFVQNQPIHSENYKNKYTKALILGLNQTNCEKVYRIDLSMECPSILDYVKSYLQSHAKRRRDHQIWRKQ